MLDGDGVDGWSDDIKNKLMEVVHKGADDIRDVVLSGLGAGADGARAREPPLATLSVHTTTYTSNGRLSGALAGLRSLFNLERGTQGRASSLDNKKYEMARREMRRPKPDTLTRYDPRTADAAIQNARVMNGDKPGGTMRDEHALYARISCYSRR